MKLTKSLFWPADRRLNLNICSTVRYVLAVGVIGCAYNLVAALFVAINVAGRKKTVGGGEVGTVLLICADVVSIYLSTPRSPLYAG